MNKKGKEKAKEKVGKGNKQKEYEDKQQRKKRD